MEHGLAAIVDSSHQVVVFWRDDQEFSSGILVNVSVCAVLEYRVAADGKRCGSDFADLAV